MTDASTSRLTVSRTIAPRRKQLPEATPAPFVKWVGGKTRLLGELVARAPSMYGRYFEPFVGGGALFFRLAPRAAVLSDLNADLIATYQAVRDEVELVVRYAARHKTLHSEEYYYQVRERWNVARKSLSASARAAMFMYMNKTCYNGLWRVNRRGEFNVPVGRYANPSILDAESLRAASFALQHAELSAQPFDRVLDEAEAGDFVYFDPPYDPVSATSDFTSYTSESFGVADQHRLADVYRKLSDRGVAVMLSNSDTPLVRKLYTGFRIDRVMCSRAINSKAEARGAVAEVIVTNRY
jgi:DNA adenine methylase